MSADMSADTCNVSADMTTCTSDNHIGRRLHVQGALATSTTLSPSRSVEGGDLLQRRLLVLLVLFQAEVADV